MNKKLQHFLSMLLAVVMLINLLPMSAIGAEVHSLTENNIDAATTESEDVYIVGEVIENRSEFTKEYILSNGLHMAAIYMEPVHYEDNGKWEEIDNTLKTSGFGENAVYANTAGDWDVSFPQQLSGNRPVSITKDGYTLCFTMAGEVHANPDSGLITASEDLSASSSPFALQEAEETSAQIQEVDLTEASSNVDYPEMIPDKLYSRLEYSDIFDNTDIVYDLSGGQLKESIVIGNYSESLYGYQYHLDVGGMIPVLSENGEIMLYDKEGKDVILIMPAPYLLDNAGVYCDDVTVDLQNANGTYILSYLLPAEWLANEERQWPVVLDPIVSKEADFSNAEDQNVYENTNITTSPSVGSVTCGYDPNCKTIRFYLKYKTLPALTSADVIVNASLSLYATEKSGAATIEVHKVTSEWTAGDVTWTNQPDFEQSVVDFARCTTAERFYTWEITDMVRSWYDGNNNGMVFKLSDTSEAARQTSWYRFYSSEMDLACMPVLSIVFRNNNGLEGYWDYTTTSAGRAGTGYINNYTGNLVWVHNDIGFGGNRMPVSISHIYNANDSADNTFGLGFGWRTNFNQRVYHWDNEDAATDYYVWEDSDGTYHYFVKSSEGEYLDEDGLELTLTTNGTGNATYCITDKYGNESQFDSRGRLTKQINNQATPSSITVAYSGDTYRISQITDGAGRVYAFTYTDNLLEAIIYKGGSFTDISIISFTYDSSRLESITQPDGDGDAVVVYSYLANNDEPAKYLLASAKDIDGYTVSYTYATIDKGKPARVASVTEYDGTTQGGSLTITYGQNQTTFTDHNCNVQIMQFNSFGNTIAIMDDQGKAQHAQFAFTNTSDVATPTENNGYAKGNQLRVSSKLQNTVGNILDDSSFERSVNWTATSSAVTVSVASGTAYYGTKALKLVRSTAGTAAGAYSTSFSVGKDESVTFSAYVKVAAGSAYLALNDGSTTVTSQTLGVENGWTRLEVCYTNTSTSAKTVTARLMTVAAGTIYMDCVQVEKSVTASRYNLIENGDFRHTTAWSASTGRTTVTAWLPSIGVTPTEGEDYAAAPELESNVYQLDGSALYTNRLSQTVNVSGSAGDTFVLAGWAMGDSVPLDTSCNLAREFGLIITFNHTNGTKASTIVRFNPYVTNWQYAAGYAVATKAYSSIKVEIAYDCNRNSAVFDGIQLYKEEFGSQYTYDANGNVTTATDVQGGTTTYTYDSNQNLSSVTLPDNTSLTYTYDDYHNVLTATTETGVLYEFTYDTYGNNTSVSIVIEGGKITSSANYSTDGNRLVSTTDTVGNVTQYSYDPDTNMLEWVQYPEDTANTRTEYDYDDLYRLVTAEVKTDTGQTLSASYSYTNDLLTKIQTPTTAYTFNYGAFSLRTSIKAGNYTLATYTYTNDQNKYLQQLAYGNGDSVQYTYDNQGRVTQQTYYEDGQTTPDATVTYKYDNSGALATVYDSATGITTTYYYDFAYRMMKYVESSDDHYHSVGYAYDETNNLTSLVETIDGTTYNTYYTYDNDNRISTVKNGSSIVGYTYDTFGRVYTQGITYGSRSIQTKTYQYTASGSLTSGQVSQLNIVLTGSTINYRYYYDNNGNIVRIVNGNYNTYYKYDSAGQLLREDNQAAGKTWVWTYDNAGNILSRTEYAYTTGTVGTATDTVTYTYGDSTWGDLLTGYDGKTITYGPQDKNIGNPVSNGTWTYTWEHGRELASMTDGTTTWTYNYDANGMRTSRSNGTTTYEYVYNGDSLVQMTVGSSKLYFANGGVRYNNAQYYYVTNLQGDVVAIQNSTGAVVVQYTYDAWGNVLSTTGSMASTLGTLNPIRYRGYVYDQESGLYYLQSRYYDPEVGRFINADALVSTGQGFLGNNMFAYCLNNPVNLIDPTGNCSVAAIIIEIVCDIIEACLTIQYDVPLYDQGSLNLCWAYCQTMVEDYSSGVTKTQEEADSRAKEIAISVHGERDADGIEVWNRGGWPTNMVDHVRINRILDLFLLLQDGPVYAYYWSGKPKSGAHLVVVTGVNVLDGTVYTNNPWGISGEQSFNDFLNGFLGKPGSTDMPLYSIIPVSN